MLVKILAWLQNRRIHWLLNWTAKQNASGTSFEYFLDKLVDELEDIKDSLDNDDDDNYDDDRCGDDDDDGTSDDVFGCEWVCG